MKKLLCVLLVACVPFLSGGCKITSFQQTLGDGRTIRASDFRLFTVTTAEIQCTMNPTSGIVVLKVKAASRADVDALAAVAAGVAKGTAEGLK